MFRIQMLLMSLLVTSALLAESQGAISDKQACLLEQLERMEGSATVADVQQHCAEQYAPTELQTIPVSNPEPGNIQARLVQERKGIFNPFALTPHKPNYLMFSAMDHANQTPYATLGNDPEPLDDIEMRYQVSIKAPVWNNVLGSGGDLNFGFTIKSWWQLFNKEVSSPFRETNYQPELFFQKFTDWSIGGWQVPGYRLGFVHESNGRNIPLSRSWNRIYAEFALERGNWALTFKPWFRIPEDKKDFEGATEGDDNPSMWKYMGYGEYSAIYQTRKNHTWRLMTRYNFHSDAKGAAELTWSFPINKRFRGIAQVFTGYGDSLIDYNESITRFSIGIALTDILH